MRPVSDQWDGAVRSGFAPTARCEVWRDNAKVSGLALLPGGTVATTESSKVRTTATLMLALDHDTDLDALLSLDDTDVRLWQGMDRADGSHEEVSVLWGRVTAVSRQGWVAAPQVQVSDYAYVMQGARLLKPWSTPAGRLVVDEIAALVHDVDPSIEVVDATGLAPAPRTTAATWDRERWDAVLTLAAGMSCEAVWSGDRVLIIRPVPTATGDPDWIIDADDTDAVMTDLTISSDAPGWNAVVASSAPSTGVPVTAIAYAPSWRAGVKRPRFYSSPLLRTTAQCLDAARSVLAKSLRYQSSLSPQASPNYALEVGDVVTVKQPGGHEDLRVVSALSWPVGPGPMAVDTRIGVDIATTLTVGDLS